MTVVLRKTVLHSTMLAKFPGFFHAVFVGPRVRVDSMLGSNQPAYQLLRNAIRSSGHIPTGIAMNDLVHSSIVTNASMVPYAPKPADGMITNRGGVYLAISTADCVPILAYDPIKRVVGIAHAGWKGTVNGIAGNLVISMVKRGARLPNIRIWLGPSAKSCCYEVRGRKDTYRLNRFLGVYGDGVVVKKGTRTFLDLHRAIFYDLRKAGVGPRSIETSSVCTIHDDRFPSHRRERTKRNTSLYSVIGLRDTIESLRNKNVLVMGLGLHGGGVDTARWSVSQGARVVVTDLQTERILAPSVKKLKGLGITFILGRHRYRDVRWADIIVASPGVPRESPYLRYAKVLSKPIENDASIFFTRCTDRTIGITGTKGKTTVAVLTSAMLRIDNTKVIAVGHHQVPLLSFLRSNTSQSIVVAELSSWRLERMAARAQSPHIAVVTNVMPDHLNRYRGMSSYIRVKRSILEFQNSDDHAILNRDNRITRTFGTFVRSHRWWYSTRPFSEENGAFLRNDILYIRDRGRIHRIVTLPTYLWDGEHRREDLLAATLSAWLSGATKKAITKVVVHPLVIPHRMELARTFHGIRYINDSAATTPEAAIATLTSLKGPIVLIAGGTDKKLRYSQFAREITKRSKAVILFDGTATNKMLRYAPLRKKARVVSTMHDAVTIARSNATNGATVLLSPGAASFGLFKHEYDRGDQFRSFVYALKR